ncbi:hypothetical protein O4J56_06450 [Nocardiopsis sp. RSe5-2]|uniref:Uncharacterized protein n=1 Tax=Nocardiopsis endophytica TaxID=3018445 RepID=A0ABT4U1C8_9ACTN|nr:hypothetical protein [Nocardiopsis endophytica]MDA2810275.1 hypothetical protein [Nocardiopsis endophytica]
MWNTHRRVGRGLLQQGGQVLGAGRPRATVAPRLHLLNAAFWARGLAVASDYLPSALVHTPQDAPAVMGRQP